MSLKGIELQIAIPKTFDAGKVAEQKQQRAQLMQDQANIQTEKQAEKNKETVMEAEHSGKTDPDKKKRQEEQVYDREQSRKESKKKAKHPYKGSFVDFSG
ncbi:hypothetical protein [Sporosarcina ureilytica]|uniref:RNA polymerase subunit sigma n=1 Tax=Sporosarcina ureilytica TaxID=298596 RepID=A0A1D8JHR0_9BACL|nr:hypothetical protein [Sporosarcina ureilytica]AOV08247.1 hypothetical protein BI350_12360 [Sporosarcina ureilytica]